VLALDSILWEFSPSLMEVLTKPKPPNGEWCEKSNECTNCTAIYEPAWIGNGYCDDMSSYSTEPPNLVDTMEAIVNLRTTPVCSWIEKVYIEQILAWGGSACEVRPSARSSLLFTNNVMVHFSLVSRSSYARREGSSDEDTLLLEVEPPTADRGDVRTIKNMFYKSGSALHVWIALQEKAGGVRLGAMWERDAVFPTQDSSDFSPWITQRSNFKLHEQCSSKQGQPRVS